MALVKSGHAADDQVQDVDGGEASFENNEQKSGQTRKNQPTYANITGTSPLYVNQWPVVFKATR